MNKEIPSVEQLAEQIHGVYCQYKKEIHGEDYWTGGDYSKLTEEWKEADRYMARFVIQAITQHTAELKRENEQLERRLKLKANLLERYRLLDEKLDFNAWEAGGGVPAVNWAAQLIEDNTALQQQLTEAQSQLVEANEKIERLTAIGAPFPPTVEDLKGQLVVLREGVQFAYDAACMTYDNSKKQPFFDKYRKKYAKNGCFSQQVIIDTLLGFLTTIQPTYDQIRREWREEVSEELRLVKLGRDFASHRATVFHQAINRYLYDSRPADVVLVEILRSVDAEMETFKATREAQKELNK